MKIRNQWYQDKFYTIFHRTVHPQSKKYGIIHFEVKRMYGLPGKIYSLNTQENLGPEQSDL